MANTTLDTKTRSVSDPLCTISRRSSAFNHFTSRMIGGDREQYPTNRDIRRYAQSVNGRFHTAGHLSRDDLIWSAVMVSNMSQEKWMKMSPNHRDEYFEDLVAVGILDRVDPDHRNFLEEKLMRYSAVMSSFVMDHVTNIEDKVCAPHRA